MVMLSSSLILKESNNGWVIFLETYIDGVFTRFRSSKSKTSCFWTSPTLFSISAIPNFLIIDVGP